MSSYIVFLVTHIGNCIVVVSGSWSPNLRANVDSQAMLAYVFVAIVSLLDPNAGINLIFSIKT